MKLAFILIGNKSSPRMWGCFFHARPGWTCLPVFPTHVGVFPYVNLLGGEVEGLPHACGGVSMPAISALTDCTSSPRMWGCFLLKGGEIILDEKSSPRMWGCFQKVWKGQPVDFVFPTHVGVFLIVNIIYLLVVGLPHACGGVSISGLFSQYRRQVFPTHVGVFPTQFVS